MLELQDTKNSIMKFVIISIVLFLSNYCYSQQIKLKDYFFSEVYNQKEYKWNIGVSEYEETKLDNNLIVVSSVKYLENGTKVKGLNYYQPYDSIIYHTVQWSDIYNRYVRIDDEVIRYPESTWVVSDDQYTSYFTKTKTEYNHYDNCLAVEISSKDFGSYRSIKYYAIGIGLVKEETVNEEGDMVLKKELVDYRLPPSEEDVTIKNELKEMRLKIYSYEDYYPEEYQMFVESYSDKLASRLKGYSKKLLATRKSYWKYDFRPTERMKEVPTILYQKQYDRVYSDVGPTLYNVNDLELNKLLRIFINDEEFPLVCFDFEGVYECQKVTTSIEIKNYPIDLAKGVTIVRKNSKGKLRFLEKNLTREIQLKIEELLGEVKKGKYLVSYLIGSINKSDVSEIAIEIM